MSVRLRRSALESFRSLLYSFRAFPYSHADSFYLVIKAFGIFEGGGAKGLAHVGALRAAEEYDVRFEGVAGASAGAIVAALVAAGHTSQELFDTSDAGNSGVLDRDFVQLLGVWRWRLVNIVRIARRFYKSYRLVRLLTVLFLLLIPVALSIAFFLFHGILVVWSWIIAATVMLIFCGTGLLAALLINLYFPLGLFSTHQFEEWLNECLSSKLFSGDKTKSVTFADLKIPLKIITTDIRSRRPLVFGNGAHDTESVAKVVAYSIAIPFAFKPHVLTEPEHVLVDGGVLSNFPAWVFDDQRAALGGFVYTLGFRLHNALQTAEVRPWKKSLKNYLSDLSTVFFGDSLLQIREIEDLHLIPIKVSASTLDFDLDAPARRHLFNDGYVAALTFFKQFKGRKNESTITTLLKILHRESLDLLNKDVRNLRINIALPVEPMRRKIRVVYSYNMELDNDDRLELKIDGGAMGRCWNTRAPVLVDMANVDANLDEWKMTKYEQALVRKSVKTLVSIPIFDREVLDRVRRGENNEPLGILNIDSDSNLLEDFKVLSGTVGSDLGNLIDGSVKHIAEELMK